MQTNTQSSELDTLSTTIQEVRRASRTIVRELGFLSDRNALTGVTNSEGHALIELNKHQLLTSKELSKILQLDKSTTCRILSQLCQQQLVEQDNCVDDARCKPYRLNSKGRAKLEEINIKVNRQVGSALELLTEKEQACVNLGMGLYAKALARFRARNEFTIRKVKATDDKKIAAIIRKVSAEFGLVGAGYSSEDPEVDSIYQSYSGTRAAYLVVEQAGEIVGGGGFGPLQQAGPEICELRKMYFLPQARGFGLGAAVLEKCLELAKSKGYRLCYLESKDVLIDALRLYKSFGFRVAKKRLGNTGHAAANCCYVKQL